MMSTSDKTLPLWRQPFLHFIAIGILIFAWDALRPQTAPSEGETIVVTVPQVERMAVLWSKTWGRPPTDEELQSLVQDHIKEEIYYREAKQLGLDTNDAVIRRRLRQKMEFLTTDAVSLVDPDMETLRAFYDKNLDRYKSSAVFDFTQVYYKTAQTDRIMADLTQLKSGANSQSFGDVITLPRSLERADEAQIARLFGSSFYEQLDGKMNGDWTGPITSGFGQHLVRASIITPAKILSFEEAKDAVELDWRNQTQQDVSREAFNAVREKYTIEIEMPDI